MGAALADIDGDGRLDVVSGRSWYRNGSDGTWTRRLLTTLTNAADPFFDDQSEVDVVDIDGDGRSDVVVGRAWYRSELDGTWTRHEYTDIDDDAYPAFRDYTKVSVLDLDEDGRPDVFATLYAETPAGRAYAFLAPPDPATDAWTPVEIDPGPLFGVHSQAAAAFDGSGRPQIMVGETGIGGFDFGVAPDPHIKIHRLLGAATDPAAWEHALVDAIGTHEATAVDLDGDGLPDLIGHEENAQLVGRNGGVFAWQNRTAR